MVFFKVIEYRVDYGFREGLVDIGKRLLGVVRLHCADKSFVECAFLGSELSYAALCKDSRVSVVAVLLKINLYRVGDLVGEFIECGLERCGVIICHCIGHLLKNGGLFLVKCVKIGHT